MNVMDTGFTHRGHRMLLECSERRDLDRCRKYLKGTVSERNQILSPDLLPKKEISGAVETYTKGVK